MRRISLIFIAYLIATIGASTVFAQSANNKIVQQIIRREAEYTAALKKLSAKESDQMETEDFMITVRIPPRIITKIEMQERQAKETNPPSVTIVSLTDSDVKVRVYGENTAIVTGAWSRVIRNAEGKDTSASGRFTRVWVKQSGVWLLASGHYSPDIDLEKLKAKTMPNTAQTNEEIQ